MNAYLILQDGTVMPGHGFGYPGTAYGEVVFTTAMVGYPESLTDPSYRGQILIMTYPLVGNYGVPDMGIEEYGVPVHYESPNIQVRGFVISKLMRPSHWSSRASLDEWMRREMVPGIEGIDTRALVKKIREEGVMMGAVVNEDIEPSEVLEKLSHLRYDDMNFINEVSPENVMVHAPPHFEESVIVLDCGLKYGILRELLRRRIRVIRVPCSHDPISAMEEYRAQGIFLSNGPGNPGILKGMIKNAREIIDYGAPTMGVCLGAQILALADDADIYKLRYGHRGINKPVKDLRTGRVFVTTQNHGYAIKRKSLKNFEVWMLNVDDGTVEGIYHRKKPIMATQFHPEASPGPHDSLWVFDKFKKLLRRYGR